MAKCTPSSSRPGTGRSRGFSAPPASTTASNSARRPRTVSSAVAAALPAPIGAVAHARDRFGIRRLRRASARAAVDQALLHLEVGNAIAQQAADAVIFFEHRRRRGRRAPAAARRRGPPGPSRPRRRACPSCALAGLRRDPALFPRLVDDRVLDRLDADRIVVDAQRAGFFARRRTDAAGEFREIVGRVQRLDRPLPVLLVNQVVAVRNDVVDRAAGHAKRDAAVHAARALRFRLVVV